MTWHHEPPEGRVYALVLANGENVPFVGQYEPKKQVWVGEPGPYQRQVRWLDSEWHPLPWHATFLPRTHAVEVRK
jgi:hypothetical protein